MDKELNCDFFITRWKNNPFKQMDYYELSNLKGVYKNFKIIDRFYWQQGAVSKILKSYKFYVLIGDPSCLLTWIILLLAKVLNKKVILWSHGWYGKETNPEKFVKKLFFRLPHKILLYGNHANAKL